MHPGQGKAFSRTGGKTLPLRFQPRRVVKELLNYRLLLVCRSRGADQPGKGSISAFPLAGKSFAGKANEPGANEGQHLGAERERARVGGFATRSALEVLADINEQQREILEGGRRSRLTCR